MRCFVRSSRARLNLTLWSGLSPSLGVLMDTAIVIALGIVAWVLVAILLAVFVGRMIRLRDRPRDRPCLDSTMRRT